MADYSYSRISTYKNCPYQYKLKYIEGRPPDFPSIIEAFMGSMVHSTLEKLYSDMIGDEVHMLNSLEELHRFYRQLWDAEYSDDILIVKKYNNRDFYKKRGERFITDYYYGYYPFDDIETIRTETEDMLFLPDGNRWHIRIDRLARDPEGNYYVCDYKTSARELSQSGADSDSQLAMYSIWVRQNYPDAKKIYLRWHLLPFGKHITSQRTSAQMQSLISDITAKIRQIEYSVNSGMHFSPKITGLCNYCLYKQSCKPF